MTPKLGQIEIIAHRGASADAPENTLAALRLAWEQGADASEADFQFTRDGRLVALHDDDLLRTAGVDLRADQATLAELQAFDVGRWKGEQFAGEPIATLEEMLAAIPLGKRFFIEIKAGAEAVVELARVVRASNKPVNEIVVISLNHAVCAEAKRTLPEFPVYRVVDYHQLIDGSWTPTSEEVLKLAQDAHLDGLDLNARGPHSPESLAPFHAARLPLCCWTVDDPLLAKKLLSLGIPGITTNRPRWLREEIEND